MSLTGVLEALLDPETGDRALRQAVADAQARKQVELDLTAPTSLRPFVVASLAARAGRPVLVVTATGREAEDLVAAVRCLLPPDVVAEYPAWETLPHERPPKAPARCRSSSRRSGAFCNRRSRDSATSSPSGCGPGTRCRSRT